MRILERIYRSPIGRSMSVIAHMLAKVQQPFMVYGYYDETSGAFRKYTRMSSTVTVLSKERLAVGDHVWVWHFSILDAQDGLIIDEGVQIGAWVGIFTHGSEKAIRLLGSRFVHIPSRSRPGYTRGAVRIGAYSFIGAGSVILPGVTIGKGCLIGAGTLVIRDVPDSSIVVGQPGKVVGSTRTLDRELIAGGEFASTYFDRDVYNEIVESLEEAPASEVRG